MFLRPDTAVRVPVRLVDINNAPVTGMLPANISDGTTTGNATVVKGDSSTASLALVNSVNWFEIDDVSSPGLYHVLIPATHTDVIGTWQLVVNPDAADFTGLVITAQVDTLLDDSELVAKILKNRLQIHLSGPDANRMVIYDDDGTTPLLKWDLTDSNDLPTTVNPYTRTPV